TVCVGLSRNGDINGMGPTIVKDSSPPTVAGERIAAFDPANSSSSSVNIGLIRCPYISWRGTSLCFWVLTITGGCCWLLRTGEGCGSSLGVEGQLWNQEYGHA